MNEEKHIGPVKCADCGFLSLRNLSTGLLDEVDANVRLTGYLPQLRLPRTHQSAALGIDEYETPYLGRPLCFVRAYDLTGERLRDETDAFVSQGILHRDRDCAEKEHFVPWRQGFTPKEHQEAKDSEAAREYERRRDLAIRDREVKRDADAERWHKEQMNELQGQHRRELIVLGGFIAVATIAGAIIEGLLGQNRDLWPF